MRILIASTATIPCYSGGWSTPLDLFGSTHQAMYLITGFRLGLWRMEGVPILGLGIPGHRFRNKFSERVRCKVERELVPLGIKLCAGRFRADLVLCLDELAGFAAMKAGVPFAMRFHQKVHHDTDLTALKTLTDRALFSTASQTADVPGTIVLQHFEDMSRFAFSEMKRPERALLLCVLNDEHRPEDFVEGIMLSRSMKGDIIGAGPLTDKLRRLCSSTGGRVRLLPPLPRLRLGELSGRYQVGVATLAPRQRHVYQMKVVMYMACGMHVIASPWTETVHTAPHLLDVYESPVDLARKLDAVQEGWLSLEQRRLQALEWVRENYDIETPRRLFNELLKKHLPTGRTSP